MKTAIHDSREIEKERSWVARAMLATAKVCVTFDDEQRWRDDAIARLDDASANGFCIAMDQMLKQWDAERLQACASLKELRAIIHDHMTHADQAKNADALARADVIISNGGAI